ncbi:hypothetical protein [Neotamlana laminarinivorans]|uniref:Uncharacterized protein n=1 Tax=Neotamlana laminarinivorans TaxID=2883124 RepID=A0A9X1I1J2_9FLAO|nr:hypothetical protein [Tamlana laminarinivorans]MCB4798497.1 hypothetical protein [Tamlana laminarinivorans]
MKFKFLVFLVCVFLINSCRKKIDKAILEEHQHTFTHVVSEQEVSKLRIVEYALDAKTENQIKDWEAYFELQNIINEVKRGDLGFLRTQENEVNLLLINLEKNIPEAVDTPSISARILVLKTTMLKLKSLVNLDTVAKPEILDAIKEFLMAFNNVNFQLNKKIEFDTREINRP